ncbi:hypothetical protein AAG906_021439 [Vitis piasezkii]
MVAETCGIPSMRMDLEMTLIEASLFLTSSLKELGNINNQTPLCYMPMFFHVLNLYGTLDNPTPKDHAFPSEKDMRWHGVDHVLDTPDCNAALTLMFYYTPRDRSAWRWRVHQMAPNLLSPFISQLETRQSAIRMMLKEVVAFVFSRDLDARCMFNGSPLVQVFLPVLIKNHWTLYLYDLHNKRIHPLNSRLDRKKTTMIGIQQNLVK